ncbi:hypothetical protein [Massilia sp. Se16.2.3]|uniref:hypothetical protein n=1 Tax=Massilia sp. Se16.2.3 TaxID=2709303 RepID=UPI0015FF2A9A|nr:hypothetical protein [Massilia sp. Se16.2.3]QNA98677.1 hypothetical protein G4G31_07265 [Massilia sp. Se16.2.3]
MLALLPGLGLEAGSGLPHDAALLGALRTTLTRQGAHWSAQLEAVTERYFAGASLRRESLRATAEFRVSRNLSVAIGAATRQAPRREQEAFVGLKWRQPSLVRPWQK